MTTIDTVVTTNNTAIPSVIKFSFILPEMENIRALIIDGHSPYFLVIVVTETVSWCISCTFSWAEKDHPEEDT